MFAGPVDPLWSPEGLNEDGANCARLVSDPIDALVCASRAEPAEGVRGCWCSVRVTPARPGALLRVGLESFRSMPRTGTVVYVTPAEVERYPVTTLRLISVDWLDIVRIPCSEQQCGLRMYGDDLLHVRVALGGRSSGSGPTPEGAGGFEEGW